MTYSIANFYDLRQAVAALAAAGCEDNAAVRFDVRIDDGAAEEPYTHDDPIHRLQLTRGLRPEVVIS